MEILTLKKGFLKEKKKPSPLIKKNRYHKELEELSKLPHLTKHRENSKAYKNAVRVVKGLTNGLVTILDRQTIDAITERLANINGREKITRGDVREIIVKKFTEEERFELYNRLSNLLSPGYWPSKKGRLPKSLPAALFNPMTSMSWLIFLWFRPPTLLMAYDDVGFKMIYQRNLLKYFKEAMRFCNISARDVSMKNRLAYIFLDYVDNFLKKIRPKMNTEEERHWGSFSEFFEGFMNFAEDRWWSQTPEPNWFSPDSKRQKDWLNFIRNDTENKWWVDEDDLTVINFEEYDEEPICGDGSWEWELDESWT